jgi:ribonuclease G
MFRELIRETRTYDAAGYLVLASQSVIDLLLDEESQSLADLENFIGKTIKLQVEPMYGQEQYDVILQ